MLLQPCANRRCKAKSRSRHRSAADSSHEIVCRCCQGGGLQDDGAPYSTAPYRLRYRPLPQAIPYGSCSGVFPFVFFFERTATLLQHKDPAAASYCKWAARALFRRIDPYNDFANVNAHLFPLPQPVVPASRARLWGQLFAEQREIA